MRKIVCFSLLMMVGISPLLAMTKAECEAGKKRCTDQCPAITEIRVTNPNGTVTITWDSTAHDKCLAGCGASWGDCSKLE